VHCGSSLQCVGLGRVQVGHKPDFADPVVCSFDRGGTTVKAFVNQISSQLLKEFKYALVWGTSSKHMPQRCGKQHRLADEGALARMRRAAACRACAHCAV
jgi:uncharacterized protein